ncbi:MAG: hypothetical protein A2V83_00690 [Nitrospirae bacterium RBG_16_64_22]|nr:MAG: hypothetical protein A2V83_00690 [Nitrospirae bacterium RBG_16_64_22]
MSILDCIKERMGVDDLRRYVRRTRPDVVGLQCYTFDQFNVRKMLDSVKEVRPQVITVLGGPHPTAVPDETFEFLGAGLDYAFRGEAEVGFPIFLDLLEKSSRNGDMAGVPGLVHRKDGDLIKNEKAQAEDLDGLGFPAWDLIRPQDYPEAQHGAFFKNFPIAPVMATRGCPFLCTFCTSAGTAIRRRSVSHVMEEIRLLHDRFGIREFHMVDDNFTLDREYAKEFARALIGSNLRMSWATPNGVRLDRLDEELLRLMKESGLYIVSLGIESGSDRVLKTMRKSLTVEKIRKNVEMVRNAGIEIGGFFVLGYPGETREDREATLRLALELDILRANFFTYLPLPGTASYRELQESGQIDRTDWERFYFMNAAWVPEGVDRKELKRFQRKAFLLFYLRPRIVWRNLWSIQSLRHFVFLARRFYHWIVMR